MKEDLFKLIEKNVQADIPDNIYSKAINLVGVFWNCLRFILLHKIEPSTEVAAEELYFMCEGIPQDLKDFYKIYIAAADLFDAVRGFIEDILSSDEYEYILQIYANPMQSIKEKVAEKIDKYQFRRVSENIIRLYEFCKHFRETGTFPEISAESDEEIWSNEKEIAEMPS